MQGVSGGEVVVVMPGPRAAFGWSLGSLGEETDATTLFGQNRQVGRTATDFVRVREEFRELSTCMVIAVGGEDPSLGSTCPVSSGDADMLP